MKQARKTIAGLYGFVAITMLTAAVLLPFTAGAGNIRSVHHEPETVTPDDVVTVTLVVKDSDDIKKVEYKYCEDDICYQYEDMDDEGSNTYTGSIPKQKGGTRIGYNISIEYDDGHKEYPSEQEKDEYIYFTVQKEDDDDSPFPGAPLLLVSLGVALALVSRKNRALRPL